MLKGIPSSPLFLLNFCYSVRESTFQRKTNMGFFMDIRELYCEEACRAFKDWAILNKKLISMNTRRISQSYSGINQMYK